MEHNFGHGKQGLSNTLMSLNLIAFAFHAVCDHLCQLWQQTRDHYSRRRRFFLALDFHTEWRYFNNWHQLFSLILDPKLRGPP